jgi:hypothetical protein
MNGTSCSELEEGTVEMLRPVMEESASKPLRYLRDVPVNRLCDWWLDDVVTVLGARGGAGFVTEQGGKPVGFCVVGELPWESEILGKRMAVVKHVAARSGRDSEGIVESLVGRAVEYGRSSGYDCLLCRAYTDDPTMVHTLEQEGFLLVDTLLVFVQDLRVSPRSAHLATATPDGVELRIAEPGDRASLVEVSRKAFASHKGRFHADPELGPVCGQRIYERWIESCLEGWADWIVVANVAGRVAGYSAWKRPSQMETRHGLGLGHYSIGAIHPEFYGRGLFTALTGKGAELLKGIATRIEGPTLVSNHPVHHGYHKLGWRIEDAFHSFHKWLKV